MGKAWEGGYNQALMVGTMLFTHTHTHYTVIRTIKSTSLPLPLSFLGFPPSTTRLHIVSN